MKKVLLIRFSALGDVAMLVPVVKELASQYTDVEVTVLSVPFVRSLFEGIADNVRFIGADVKKEYKGITGLSRLYSLLKKERFDAVADMHDVLRTKYLRLRFHLSNLPLSAKNFPFPAAPSRVKIAHIDKHRAGKKALTRERNKILVQQPTSFDNYREVLAKLGLPLKPSQPEKQESQPKKQEPQRTGAIGIAPFAAHKGKIYPLDKMKEVVRLLIENGRRIYLFGAGKEELNTLHDWQRDLGSENITVVADIIQKNLKAEISLMATLEAMLTMDSGNQHLAALSGTRVVSIWGATHPYAGFLAYGQSPADAIQADLPCRPCSIYGNKTCRHIKNTDNTSRQANYPCLEAIIPEQIVARLIK